MESEYRRLAAVMFADIEGYTRKFQKNEKEALIQIEQHRSDLEATIRSFHGDTIQFYGDGSVSVFESVKDCVKCAEELQKISIAHGIPLRIGIHMGDLIYRGKDIYGDVVNVTSRIQNEGQSGSILVSKKVADEFKNNPEIKFRYLGDFALKNVTELVPIYALEADGLTIPPVRISLVSRNQPGWKKYWIYFLLPVFIAFTWIVSSITNSKIDENERIAIPPFEDRTGDVRFQIVGMMASDWITNQLKDATTAKLMSYESGMYLTNGQPGIFRTSPSFVKKSGCRYLLEGSYTLTGRGRDSLLFIFSIIDCKTNKPLDVKLRPVICSESSPFDGIKAVTNVIMGYWKSKKESTLTEPLFDSYTYYIRALNHWNSPEPDSIKFNLLKSIQLDPKFLDAYMRLIDHNYNFQNFDTVKTILEDISIKFPDLSPRSKRAIDFYNAEISGNRSLAASIFSKFLREDPKDLFTNTTAMVIACEYQNNPELAISIFEKMDNSSFNFNSCEYCRTRVLYAVRSFNELGRITESKKWAELVQNSINQSGEYNILLNHFARLQDAESMKRLILQVKAATNQTKFLPYASYVAARESVLNNMTAKNELIQHFKQNITDKESRNYGRFLLLENKLDSAIILYTKLVPNQPDNIRLWGKLGIAVCKQNNEVNAHQIIDSINAKRPEYGFGESDYMIGRMYALLRNETRANASFQNALNKGSLFETSVNYMYDPDLMNFSSNQAYQQLLRSRR